MDSNIRLLWSKSFKSANWAVYTRLEWLSAVKTCKAIKIDAIFYRQLYILFLDYIITKIIEVIRCLLSQNKLSEI